MWFVFLISGLVVLSISGLYVRRRIASALLHFGVRAGRVRVVRWVIAWLIFGLPVLMIVSIVSSRLLGRPTLPRFDGLVASWLLTLPFAWSMLVVLQSVLWLIAIDIAHIFVRRSRGVASAARLRAFAVLAVVAAFGVYTPARVLVERNDLRIRHHVVASSSAAAASTASTTSTTSTASTASTPFRMAFLADIQQDVHTDSARAHEVYELVNSHRPDVVLSGGDWINTGPDHISAAAASAAELSSRLGTFSVRGDHEHFAYVDRNRSVREVEQAMRSHGITMLNNEVQWFTHNGKRIAVLFLNHNYIHRTDPATVIALLATITAADYKIAVTHQLDPALVALLDRRVDLVLGAHTHGGQINPVVGTTHVPLARLETPFVDGRYELGHTTILITAGVGYSIFPFRYAAPGSIEIIDLML